MVQLTVTVIEARGLLGKDADGLSDPYVEMNYNRRTETTRVAHKTLHPEWRQDFTIPLEGHHDLVLKVWDEVQNCRRECHRLSSSDCRHRLSSSDCRVLHRIVTLWTHTATFSEISWAKLQSKPNSWSILPVHKTSKLRLWIFSQSCAVRLLATHCCGP